MEEVQSWGESPLVLLPLCGSAPPPPKLNQALKETALHWAQRCQTTKGRIRPWDQGQLLCGTELGRNGPGLSSSPVPGLNWAKEASQPAPKPIRAHQWMAEHSGKQLLREIRSNGNAEN